MCVEAVVGGDTVAVGVVHVPCEGAVLDAPLDVVETVLGGQLEAGPGGAVDVGLQHRHVGGREDAVR